MTKTFNPEQYKLITECARKENFSEWNDYTSKTNDIIDLRESNLEGLKFIGANFKNADGKGANFCDANLKNAKLDGVDMSDCAFLNADPTGIEAYGSSFHEAIFAKAKIVNAYFMLCNFDEANFQQSNLTAVKFSNSHFYECSFYAADLSGALSGKCLDVALSLREPLETIFDVPLTLTLGYVRFENQAVFHTPEGKLKQMLKQNLTLQAVNIHAWLTLPSHEIIDLTFFTSVGVRYQQPNYIGLACLGHSDDMGEDLSYHPQLVGDGFLWQTGLLLKGIGGFRTTGRSAKGSLY
ncbi:pentapeptide repeat-containing protein [Pseudomonas sp. NFR16]|uniref:pentapeptide repeat-containing protein n=1 Tax=Pseudomonas sp. NFR16 TaxID=1566248 RepID=UPI0008C59CEE|nr:pentapeptide repeat-containing protein [Pseudomonas sp. NFR16]SEJ77353.1 Pentapeptide repeat-containing protein [Pseudomonas sp. NFR16]